MQMERMVYFAVFKSEKKNRASLNLVQWIIKELIFWGIFNVVQPYIKTKQQK